MISQRQVPTIQKIQKTVERLQVQFEDAAGAVHRQSDSLSSCVTEKTTKRTVETHRYSSRTRSLSRPLLCILKERPKQNRKQTVPQRHFST